MSQSELAKAVKMRKADVLDVLGQKVLERELKSEGERPVYYALM